MKTPNDIEPGVLVVIGHVDDQRIPLPVAARVPHPQLDVSSDMWTSVDGDDAIGVVVLVDDHHLPRRLKNPHRISIVDARHTVQKASRDRINVLRLRRVTVLVIEKLGFLRRPRLVRNLPVRRVHNRRSRRYRLTRNPDVLCAIGFTCLDAVRRDVVFLPPMAPYVRLAVRSKRWSPGLRWRRQRLADGWRRRYRQDSRHRRHRAH